MTELWQQINELWRCDHEATELRYKVDSRSRRFYENQCLVCGHNCGRVKIAELTPETQRSAPPWDRTLSDRWWKARDSFYKKRREQAEQEEHSAWWQWYSRYLESAAWDERRRLVLQRAQGICEGCNQRRAVQVHHLTYDRAGHELLFDLVAVCIPCHQIAHPDKEISDTDPNESIYSLISPPERTTA